MIGGTHFWGHADIYIAIPLTYPTYEIENQSVTFLRGVETAFKYYPWRIENKKIRPFIGMSIAPFYYQQDNNDQEFGDGPGLSHTSIPLLTGFTYNVNNHLIELGATWNYRNEQDYFISRIQEISVETPPIYLNLSYRFMIETTLSAEKNWESGQTKKKTEELASTGDLNSFYIGGGLSSAFWLKKSSYNQNQRPYTEGYGISIMPDFTLGYYFHNPDLNIGVAYRSYGTSVNTYGTEQFVRRRSMALEATKYIGDYPGFAAFVGPAISYESLLFEETFENQQTQDLTDNKFAYGLTFGWDIRPNRLQTWILRTNLRWFPNLELDIDNNSSISFDNIEFNFIQFILYPGRIK